MTIKAILWTYEKSHSGMADIKIYTYPPKKYHSTGIKIFPKYWDKKKERVKNTLPSSITLNSKIQKLIDDFTIKLHSDRVGDGSLILFLEIFIEECEKNLHPIKESTLKKYRSTLTRLVQYSKFTKLSHIDMNKCDLVWYSEFCRWLADYGNCNAPGIEKHKKVLKRVLKLAMERKLHDNDDYKRFTSAKSSVNKIYLRKNEIELLRVLNLTSFTHLELERDRFLVAYFLLMRFGDSVKIDRANAYKENDQWIYSYISEKTNIRATIPISKIALELLNKNNWDFSKSINQMSNRYLKQIAALAGINDIVKEGDKVAPKAQFVTTHTSRRSAATNMSLDGINIDIIAKLGGWGDIRTLKIYLRASDIDVARAAASLDFFK